MKIVKAQKKIAHLKGEIAELRSRATLCVSTVKGNSFNDDFKKLLTAMNEKVTELVSLKTKIVKMNIEKGVFDKIATLGELRSFIVFLRGLEIKQGKIAREYGEAVHEYESQISETEKNDMIAETQKKIEKLTDELDDFNAEMSI